MRPLTPPVPSVVAILLLGFMAQSVDCAPCEPPAEIGPDYTLRVPNFTGPGSSGVIEWRTSTLILYDSTLDIPDRRPDISEALAPPDSGLTVVSPQRGEDGTSFRLVIDGDTTFSCELQVYEKPLSLSCSDWTYFGTPDPFVSVYCATPKVYPEALCQFSMDSIIETPTPSSKAATGDPTFYNSGCEFRFPVGNKSEGYYTLTVHMWPDLPGLNAANAGINISKILPLALPAVAYTPPCLQGDNIREGYLLSGTSTSCDCEMLDWGVPEGGLDWLFTPGTARVERPTLTSKRVVISDEGTFTCVGTTVLQGRRNMTSLEVAMAFGPSDNSGLSLATTSPVYQCPTTQTVTCQVDQNSYSPAPDFSIVINNTTLSTSVPLGNVWEALAQMSVNTSGEQHLSCEAKNRVFPQSFSQEISRVVQVYEVPPTGPALTVQLSGETVQKALGEVWVIKDTNVTVQCTAPGQDGLVTSTKITCGSQSVNSNGNTATLPDMVINENTRCTCEADHAVESECPQNPPQLTTSGNLKVDDHDSDDDFPVIPVAVTLGVVGVIVVMVVIGLILWRRKRQDNSMRVTR